MAKFTEIYSSQGAFNGVSYRATSNGNTVHLQSSEDFSKPWKTRARIPQATWEKYAKKWDVYNPYKRNPADVLHMLREVAGEEE